TMRMLDVFLLHCLLSDSPDDSPEEISQLKHNQHLVAERGREPGLQLQRGSVAVTLTDWASEVLSECVPLAASLDAAHATTAYSEALALAQSRVAQPHTTPSARVLEQMRRLHGNSFTSFGLTQSLWARDQLLDLPWSAQDAERFAQMAQTSVHDQQAIEAADTGSFEAWRQRYMDPAALG
ncbi:MAG: glutamate--cysteine ligase, partial [Comamonas sp.]|nr:glutamate--cysteine ligase [Candidatus Comamonas equi]